MSIALLEGKQNPIREKAPHSIGKEEKAAVLAVMEDGELSHFLGRSGEMFLGGKRVKELERQVREYFGVAHAVSFNSGSTALQAAVAALGIGPGDEVITSPFTMSATASAILLNNALPVFADISPDTYCIDPVSIEKNITPRTKAILAVNLFGASEDYEKIKDIAQRHKLKIIEDNAQSIGAAYQGRYTGTIGDIGVCSFNFHKIIHSGEGGILVIDDLIAQGAYEPVVGSNYRLSELHAAIAIEQFKKLERIIHERRQAAEYLTHCLKKFSWIVPYELEHDNAGVYYVYPFRILSGEIGIQRKTLARAMEAEGFPVGEGYQKPLYLLPLYQREKMFLNSQYPFMSLDYGHGVKYSKGLCPVAESMYEKDLVITTIFQPPNTLSDIDEFISVIKKIEEYREELREYEKKTAH